jgi:hypothetical protein
VPGGSPRSGATRAFVRCGEWGYPLLEELGGVPAVATPRRSIRRALVL